MMIELNASTTRAKRFPIHAAVQYRAADMEEWHKGRTENVSCSGALIAGRYRVTEATPVEMLLPLPRQLSGNAQVQVLCRGRVVRVAAPALPVLRSKFAVRWRELRVVNGDLHALRHLSVQDDWQALVHEMYNELAIIVGSSDLLIDPNEEGRRQRIAAIKQASHRTVGLLDRLASLLRRRPPRN
jgi:hypothetical protein